MVKIKQEVKNKIRMKKYTPTDQELELLAGILEIVKINDNTLCYCIYRGHPYIGIDKKDIAHSIYQIEMP